MALIKGFGENISSTNGKTRRNSGRNDPRSTGGHPKLQLKKGDSK